MWFARSPITWPASSRAVSAGWAVMAVSVFRMGRRRPVHLMSEIPFLARQYRHIATTTGNSASRHLRHPIGSLALMRTAIPAVRR